MRIDGATFAADTIHGAGAREDRPVTVFREIPVAVGARAIEVAFRPLVHARDADEDSDRDDAAIPLAYSEGLTLGPREVALVTFDPARRALVRVESP